MFALPMQLIAIIPGLGATEPSLLRAQFQAWQGFLRVPVDWAPVIRAAWLSAACALPWSVAAYLLFLRGDITGE